MRRRLISAGKRLALYTSARLRTADLLRPRNQHSVSALLFHRFFDPDEPKHRGIERLRRELDWLRTNYTPISLPQFIHCLRYGDFPDRAVLVTTDDALIDLLAVHDEFRAFNVPLSVFVCVGWTASESKGSGEDLVARAAAAIQWYEGEDLLIRLGGGRGFALSPANKVGNIDRLITERTELLPYLEELCNRIEGLVDAPRKFCTWSELQSLAAAGVSVGAHSVTHVWMSTTTEIRRHFEIAESKRLCEMMIPGSCQAFAYPYGMIETQSESTRVELKRTGYEVAFLTHSEFITGTSDTFTLPRITMSDESMSLREFQARASGAGIAMRRLKALIYTSAPKKPSF